MFPFQTLVSSSLVKPEPCTEGGGWLLGRRSGDCNSTLTSRLSKEHGNTNPNARVIFPKHNSDQIKACQSHSMLLSKASKIKSNFLDYQLQVLIITSQPRFPEFQSRSISWNQMNSLAISSSVFFYPPGGFPLLLSPSLEILSIFQSSPQIPPLLSLWSCLFYLPLMNLIAVTQTDEFYFTHLDAKLLMQIIWFNTDNIP